MIKFLYHIVCKILLQFRTFHHCCRLQQIMIKMLHANFFFEHQSFPPMITQANVKCIYDRRACLNFISSYLANIFLNASFFGSGMAAHHAFFGGGDARS